MNSRVLSAELTMNAVKTRQKIANLLEEDPQKAKELALELLSVEPEETVNYKNLAICFAHCAEMGRFRAVIAMARKKFADAGRFFDETEASIFRDLELHDSLRTFLLGILCAPDRNDDEKSALLRTHSDIFLNDAMCQEIDRIQTSNHKDSWVIAELMFMLFNHNAEEYRLVIKRLLTEFDGDQTLDERGKFNLATVCLHFSQGARGITLLNELTSRPDPEPKRLLELGKAYHRYVRNKEALQVLDRLLGCYPDHEEANRIKAYILHYSDTAELPEIKATTLRYGKIIRSGKSKQFHRKNPTNEPVKIGFFSHSFKAHPVGWMSSGFFCESAKFKSVAEIHILAGLSYTDFIAQTIKDSGNHFHDFSALADNEIEREINKLNLDVIVDMDGFTAACKPQILLKKLAPVLVKWVGGLAGSMWLPEYDYLITDRNQTPAHLESSFSEKLLIMDNSYVTYTPPPYKLQVFKPAYTVNEHITFGCFNNCSKYTDTCLDAWASVLRGVEDSVLLLKDNALSDMSTRQIIRSKFKKLGIGPSQLRFQGRTDHENHLLALAQVDIALDPIPYNGGLSTVESVYMGVPVITLAGSLLAHRHAVSHLTTIGHDELVANSIPEYIDKAIGLATNREQITEYREILRNDLFASPLLNHELFADELIKKLATLVN